MNRPTWLRVVAVTLAVGTLTACGPQDPQVSLPTAVGGGISKSPGDSLPEVSGSPTRTLAPPSQTRTRTPEQTTPPPEESASQDASRTPTRSRSPEATEAPEPEPTDTAVALPPASATPSASQTKQSVPPATTASTTPESPDRTASTSAAPSSAPPTSATATNASPSQSTDSATASPSSTLPTTATPSASAPADETGTAVNRVWLPWLVVLAALAGGLVWLLTGRTRRGRWDEQWQVEREQARWVLDELLPAVINPAGPPSTLAAHWAGAGSTLDQLADGLGALVTQAPDAGRRESAQTMAAALADVRRAMDVDLTLRTTAQVQPPDERALGASAAAVHAARDRLAAAIAATEPSAPAR